jgi:hypothetical protein
MIVMSETTITRRSIVAGVAAAVGGTAIAPAAHALPRGARGRLHAASELLAPFGIAVHGEQANARVAHDVLTVEVAPRRNTQYDYLLGQPDDERGIIPCIKTSFFEGVEQLSLFDPDQSAIVPCVRTVRQGGAVVTEHFDPSAAAGDPADGEIVPCVRTTVAGPIATFEGFDPTEGDIVPCIRVETEMLPGGALGAVAVEVDPALRSFSVQVGELVYRLEGGELVLDGR